MIKLNSIAEKFLWNNLKGYLQQFPSCLCDNILHVEDAESDDPVTRYHDMMVELDRHIGLGSYTLQEPSQFSNLPYVNVRITPVDMGNCSTEIIMSFDVVFATDIPRPDDGSTKYVGNSSEAVAAFRANMCMALDELMFNAYDPVAYPDGLNQAFFDRLRDQTLSKPGDPEKTALWKYNVIGSVYAETEISEVSQLKKEDRNSGLSFFQVTYHLDLNKAYGDGINCEC